MTFGPAWMSAVVVGSFHERQHGFVASGVIDSARCRVVLGILCVSLLIVSLDDTILNIALPALVRDLRATESQLQWIVDVYACVFAGLLLVAGSVGDRFGRKRVLLAGLTIFAVGSAYSAFSDSVTALI
jgi:MFS family permease